MGIGYVEHLRIGERVRPSNGLALTRRAAVRGRPSRSTPCWPALSGCFHLNSQFQTGASNLILKRQPHKLSLALAERMGEASGPFGADGSAALLYVAQVCSGDSKKLRAFRETLFVRLAQARQRSTER